MTAHPWRIVFFGTPVFAIPPLQGLLQSDDRIVAVVTQPDRERGRGRKVTPSPVKELALQHQIALLQPEKAKDQVFQERIRVLQPDLFIVVAYGQILPKSLLEIPNHGAVNIHASLLPKYRGAAPIPWAILNGEAVTGVTTMMLDEGLDTGAVLLQAEIPIEEKETAETLSGRLSLLGARLLRETIRRMKQRDVQPIAQDPSQATYAPPLKKENGRIDWTKEAEEIDRRVRAFNPWPGAFTGWEGRVLKIYRGEVRERTPDGKPGSVSWVGSDFIEVETGQGLFLIREIQLEGKKRMSARDFLPGHPVRPGTVFG